jgi:hypothetical protein
MVTMVRVMLAAYSGSGHLTQGNDGGNDGDRAVSFLIPADVRVSKFGENYKSEMAIALARIYY